jgi:hypothetical protein
LRNPIFKPIRKAIMIVQHLWGGISTQKRLLLLGLVSISALVTFTAWILVSHAQSIKSHSVNQFGMALAHALARGGAEALSNSGNLDGLRYYILTEMVQTPAIAYIALVDSDGKVLLDSQRFIKPKAGSERIFPYYTHSSRAAHDPGGLPQPSQFQRTDQHCGAHAQEQQKPWRLLGRTG